MPAERFRGKKNTYPWESAMVIANSTLHLQRARAIPNGPAALAEYFKAIEAAVEELKRAHAARAPRRR